MPTRQIDNAFKALITAGWSNMSNGDVEAPTGHFAIIDMITERDMLRDVLAESDLADALDSIEPKWYGVRENSDGLVFLESFDCEWHARKWFDQQEELFETWESNTED